jgi:thioredoxin reductase
MLQNSSQKQFKRGKNQNDYRRRYCEVNVNDDSVSVKLQSGKEMQADYLLAAIGRAPFTKGAGMEDIGVEFTGTRTRESQRYLQTSVDNIYAIAISSTNRNAGTCCKQRRFGCRRNIVNGNKEIPTYMLSRLCVYESRSGLCRYNRKQC